MICLNKSLILTKTNPTQPSTSPHPGNHYSMPKYLLSTSSDKSRTWSNFVRQLSKQYGLEDPLRCLNRDPPSKSSFKSDIECRIKAFHEQELRTINLNNQKLKYFDISLQGLSGRNHHILSGIYTSTDVKKSRYHLKMLIGDLYTYEVKSEQSGGSPHC